MSDSSPKSDRSMWVVPIVVAVIAAIGTVIAALAPSLSGGDDGSAPSSGDTPPHHLGRCSGHRSADAQ